MYLIGIQMYAITSQVTLHQVAVMRLLLYQGTTVHTVSFTVHADDVISILPQVV